MKHFLTRVRHWWMNTSAVVSPKDVRYRLPILLVVEGTNDILFLKHISALLSRHDHSLPDLQTWELERRCLFLPTGGEAASWTLHLAALLTPQFYLFDRETGSATDARRSQVLMLNMQRNVNAFLTSKRALENYLSPEAIYDGLGLEIAVDDDSPVADDTAQAIFRRTNLDRSWDALPPRARKRRRDRAKRLLNTIAVRHMSATRLAVRDPQGELEGWLQMIVELSKST